MTEKHSHFNPFTQHALLYSDSSSSQARHQSIPLQTNHSFHYPLCYGSTLLHGRASGCSQRLPLALATTKPCQFTLTITSPSDTVRSSHSGLNTACRHRARSWCFVASFKIRIKQLFVICILLSINHYLQWPHPQQTVPPLFLRKPSAEYTPQLESKHKFPWAPQQWHYLLQIPQGITSVSYK